MKELIDAAKAKPGTLSYGSTGSGSSNHLSMELFRLMTATQMIHMPYKGSAPDGDRPARRPRAGGVRQRSERRHAGEGRQTARARHHQPDSARRSLPDIPTVAEAGVPGYEVGVWFGIVAPAATPPDVLAKLNAELNKILAMPDVKQKFADQGVDPVGGTRERFGEHLRRRSRSGARW